MTYRERNERMRKARDDLGEELRTVPSGLATIIESIPPRTEPPPLPPNWLHNEILERYRVLAHAKLEEGMNVLEIGSGSHALATVPLAYMVGEKGRVVAVEIERWRYFPSIMRATGLWGRVIPLACDARRLPFPFDFFDVSLCVHGIRSMHNSSNIVQILREMLRVSRRIFVAESLPIAKTKAQAAHLEMYNLREEIFELVLGTKDDIHYLPFKKVSELVKKAGGRITNSKVLDIGLPHYLAFIPKDYVEKIKDKKKRKRLIKRWQVAYGKLMEHGEEHPPVAVLHAVRARFRS